MRDVNDGNCGSNPGNRESISEQNVEDAEERGIKEIDMVCPTYCLIPHRFVLCSLFPRPSFAVPARIENGAS